MKTNHWKNVHHECFIFLLLVIFLVGCAQPSVEPTATLPFTVTLVTLAATPIAPTNTPQPTSTPTGTPEPNPTATQTPIPWSLKDAIAKLPEVYNDYVSAQTVETYLRLLIVLPDEVQRWITDMGWGLEDFEISHDEIGLLEILAEKNVFSGMSILTKPEIIDGISTDELAIVKEYDIRSLEELLQDDIDELSSLGLLSEDGLAGIYRLIEMAATNYEIAKGFYLISNFGHPDQRLFSYTVPEFNTQLYVLGQILDLGIPDGYEIAALAAALDYGTLWTIADEEVRSLIPEYAVGMIDFQEETDQIIALEGANWIAREFPLEAQISLVWGAPGNYYSLTKDTAAKLGLNYNPEEMSVWAGFRTFFTREPFSMKNMDFNFISLEYLREMRSQVIADGIINNSLSEFSYHLSNEYWYNEKLHYNWEGRSGEIDGDEYYYGYLTAINFQWERFKGEHGSEKKFIGGSGDAFIAIFLAKSINYPTIQQHFVSHIGAYLNLETGIFHASDTIGYLERIGETRLIDKRIGWNVVPWENLYILNTAHRSNTSGRIRIVRPMTSYVWIYGIPKGYIYRADVSTDLGPWP